MAVALIGLGFALDALVVRFIISRFYNFFSSFQAVQQYGLYVSNFYSVYSVLLPVSVAVIILWLNRKRVGLVA